MAENQVTVRFESTPEVNNDRVSYAKIIPFVKTTDKAPVNGKKYYTIKDGIYVESNDFAFLVDRYYEKNYEFLDDINYYYFDGSDYKLVKSIKTIRADLDYYVKNATFLLSGPIEIFATVDVLYTEENGERIAHPTSEEMTNEEYLIDGEFDIDLYTKKSGNKIALYSPFVTELASAQLGTYDSNVIIFVENVNRDYDTQTNRGAYFFYVGSKIDEIGEIYGEWQEILLGTHTHSNLKNLEDLTNLPISKDKQSIVVVNPDGTFSAVEYDKEDCKCLPDLPENILNKIQEAEYYKSLSEPIESEWHHLDADLAKLSDTYDWLKKDENGNYTNLAIGNCRELYRQLLRADKKLWINKNFELSTESGETWIQLEAFKTNFDTETNFADCENAIEHPSNSNQVLLKLEFNWNVYTNDKMILFYGSENKILHEGIDYSISLVDKNTVTFVINRRSIKYDPQEKLTVLFLRDAEKLSDDYVMELYNIFNDEKITIYQIDAELIRLYIESEFARRPNIPRLYLSTNEYGTLEWTNKLLPAQHFYASNKPDTIEEIERDNEIWTKLVFNNVNYKVDEDYPILIVGRFIQYNAEIDSSSERNLTIYIPEVLEPEEVIQLIVIKNNVAESVAEEISKNYISREDAIAILSHGKINLSEYAKHKDLLNYAKINHFHAQYALKDHDHDFRYANYHHTHPEISALIAKILTAKTEITDEASFKKLQNEVKIWMSTWLAELAVRDKDILEKFIKALGLEKTEHGNYFITEKNVLVQDNTLLNGLNDRLLDCGLDAVEGPLYLYDYLEKIILLFEYDTVLASQVKLEHEIPIYLKNGSIGGLTEEQAKRRGYKYKEGTTLEEILTDIINPRDMISDVRKILTPSKVNTRIHFYKFDSESQEYKHIRHPESMRFPISEGELAFKIELKNYKDEDCKYFVNGKDNQFWINMNKHIKCNYNTDITGEYYIYSDEFKFGSNTGNELTPIEISWDDVPIFDNYGVIEETLNSGKIIKNVFTEVYEDEFKNGDIILHNEVPEFFIGITNNISELPDMVGRYEDWRESLPISAGQSVIILVQSEFEDELKILERNNGNITKFFKDIENPIHLDQYEEAYTLFYYTVAIDVPEFDIKVSIAKDPKKRKPPMLKAFEDDGKIVLKYV